MKVLIVDDNAESRYLLEVTLKAHNHEVVSAENGKDALEKLSQGGIDLILSDILMPVMDGYQLCRECKLDESLKGIPFVFISASYTDEKDEQFALNLGAASYVRRPIDADALMSIIEEAAKERPEGHAVPEPVPIKEETHYLAEYSERVFSQLERKVKALEAEIAARKQAEKAQQAEVTFSNMLIDGLPGVFALLDAHGGFVRWNRNLEELQGMSPAEMSGANALAFVHEDDRHLLTEKIRETLLAGRANVEMRIFNKSGEIRHYVFNGNKFVREDAAYIAGFGIDITERKRSEEALQRVNRALKTLSAGNHTLAHTNSEERLLQAMCDAIVEKGGYSLAWVGYAQQDEAKTIRPVAQHALSPGYLDAAEISWADSPAGAGLTGTAVRSGQTQIAQHMPTDPRMVSWRDKILSYGYQSGIALPLHEDGRIFGTLTIFAAEPDAFDADEVSLLEELAGDLAYGITALRTRAERDLAMENNRKYQDLIRGNLEDAIQAIAATVEMRDPYTAGHERRVAELSVAIAKELGMAGERLDCLRVAGSVHDVGKVKVPVEILSKPGLLDKNAFNMIKLHAETGHEILKGISFPWPVADVVWQHHERLDGSGYPRGLNGSEILPETQILMVADVVESMMSHRPYRPALGLDAALEEITKNRGRLYSAEVVDACIRLLKEKGFVLA